MPPEWVFPVQVARWLMASLWYVPFRALRATKAPSVEFSKLTDGLAYCFLPHPLSGEMEGLLCKEDHFRKKTGAIASPTWQAVPPAMNDSSH